MQELRNELKVERVIIAEVFEETKENNECFDYYVEMAYPLITAKEIFTKKYWELVKKGKEDAVRLALHSTLEYYNNLYEVDE